MNNSLYNKIFSYSKGGFNRVADFDKFASKPDSYSLGQYKTVNINNFSLEKAIKAAGIIEVLPSEMKDFYSSEGVTFGSSISFKPINNEVIEKDSNFIPEHWKYTPIFAINPISKYWEYVIFHEIGHLFLKHTPIKTSIIEEILGIYLTEDTEIEQDIEADLFAFVILQELNFSDDYYKFLSSGLEKRFKYLNSGSLDNLDLIISPNRLNEIKDKAMEFISLGK